MKDWRVCRPPKRPVDSSLYKELSAPYCVAGVVHRAGLGSDGMFLSSLPLESGKVEPLDAIPGPPWDRWIAHTVEFSKTACALRSGDSAPSTHRAPDLGAPGRTDEYSPRSKLRQCAGPFAGTPVGPGCAV